MDKSCQTCALDGVLAYRDTCKRCVASGMFSGWTTRTCENCANRFFMGLENGPCKACFAGKVYSEWKGSPTDAELKAKDEQTDDAEKTCGTCAHFLKGGNEEPCKTCEGASKWEQAKDEPKADPVNHPTHYTSGCGFECIEMMEMVFGKEAVIDYCVVNAFKYIWRHKQKNGTEDIAKAEWYLKYACKLTEGGLKRHLTAINKMTDHIEKLKGETTK